MCVETQHGNHELGEINLPKSPTTNTSPEKPENIDIDVSQYGKHNQDSEIPVFEVITNSPKS